MSEVRVTFLVPDETLTLQPAGTLLYPRRPVERDVTIVPRVGDLVWLEARQFIVKMVSHILAGPTGWAHRIDVYLEPTT